MLMIMWIVDVCLRNQTRVEQTGTSRVLQHCTVRGDAADSVFTKAVNEPP